MRRYGCCSTGRTTESRDDALKKNENGRRGIAFAIDSLFAIAVIAVFAISVVPAYPSSAATDDAAPEAVSALSSATLRSMCLATASELSASSAEIAAMYSDGVLTAADPEMTACQLVARLETEGGESTARARNVAAQVYGPLVPAALGLAIYADNTLIYNSTFQPPSPRALHSSAASVYSYGKAGVAAEPIGPVRMEVRAWWP